MTESQPAHGPPAAATTLDPRQQAERSERALGRAVAGGLPAVAIVAAVGLGVAVGIGPALLVLAGGAILGTISLLWASIRTLSGDAPLAESVSTLGGMAALSGGATERKRAALRALKDLEFEHSVGKIDDDDYAEMVARYRGEAKSIMRELDVEIEPLRGQAEELAREFLAQRDILAASASDSTAEDEEEESLDEPARKAPSPPPPGRLECKPCATSNEPDAAFCKKCGTALHPRCLACETLNEPDAAFCKKCGERLRTGPKDDTNVRA